MLIQEVEFDVIEFEGADGEIHMIRQCSLADREELRARLNQLSEAIKKSPVGWTIGDLYDRRKTFRHQANRALALCGIDPHWVGVDHLMALLFVRKDEEGESARGWLVDLNFPRPKPTAKAGGVPQSYAQIVAALSTYVDGLAEALALAKSHPHGELLDIVQAKADLLDKQRRQSDKVYAQAQEKKESQGRAQDKLKAIQERLYGESPNG